MSFESQVARLRKNADDIYYHSDFIYADVPYYPDAKLSSYHKRYRQIFASPEVHALAEKFRKRTTLSRSASLN